MSQEKKLHGRPQWMREMRAAFGLDPDGRTTILAQLTGVVPRAPFEVVDVTDDPLADAVAAASRVKTNAPGGAA